MATNRSRIARKEIARHASQKIWTCGISCFFIGSRVGYVLCMMFLVDKPSFLTSASATPTLRRHHRDGSAHCGSHA